MCDEVSEGSRWVPKGKVGYYVVVVDSTHDTVTFWHHVEGAEPSLLVNRLSTFLSRFEPIETL